MANSFSNSRVPDAVLTQRIREEDGFTKDEIIRLLDQLHLTPDEEVDAVLLDGDSALAFGFIRMKTSDDKLDFETGQLSKFGREALAVINDTDLETEDGYYSFAGVNTLMYY